MIDDISTGQLTLGDIERLRNIPRVYNGWVRHDAGDDVLSYWKKDSGHVLGSYKRLTVHERGSRGFDNRPALTIKRTTLDEFGHVVSEYTLYTNGSPQSIVQGLQQEMDRSPGNGEFESPPETPTEIGDWYLSTDGWEKTVWELNMGGAGIVAEQTHINPNRSRGLSTRYTIKYRGEKASGGIDVVTDVGRTAGFEIAVNTMQRVDVPLSECHAQQKALQQIDGIGPAKAESLVLLGINTPAKLSEFVCEEGDEVNHSHTKAVKKELTAVIRQHVTEVHTDGGKQEVEMDE